MVEGRFQSINAFADRVGLAQSYVHQVLKSQRTAGLEFMVALHRGLGVDANELLDRDPPARYFQPLQCHVSWEPAGDDS
jgi:transcriptional regulator with XRE-family HTH domain